jgi:molecular chaperone Hsp33
MTDVGDAGLESVRAVSDEGHDDRVLPFAVEPLDVRGRVVRLGPAVSNILTQHQYPPAVARAVGEAAALTILLGSALKLEGRFQLQTKSDGLIDMLVVDFDAPDRVRAFARYDAEKVAAAPAGSDMLGKGYLAFTIDQGPDTSRYQGIVALEGQGLEAAAHQYFRQSEQIPTLVRLAVAEIVTGEGASWRAGGLMVQFLPSSPERQRANHLCRRHARGGRRLGRGPDAGRNHRGSRTRGPHAVERAVAVPSVP